MLVLAALGGNALIRRRQLMTTAIQRQNIRAAVSALAEIAKAGHRLIITHGNGPHVGMLAMRSVDNNGVADPLDVICAQTVGMIGYLVAQEFLNALRGTASIAVVLTQIEVDPHDGAFKAPSKPIGRGLSKREAEALAVTKGWTIMRDGDLYRRAVPSPMPHDVVEIEPIRRLVANKVHVICAGGGGVPVVRKPNGSLDGVEAVIDKDYSSALIAKLLKADALLLLTDVDGVYKDWKGDGAKAISKLKVAEIDQSTYAAGSMDPKVRAAADFARATGKFCAIGKIEDAARILNGLAGTMVVH